MFNIKEETQDDGIILLQFNSDNFKITEDNFDETDAEYMLLTKTKGRAEGLYKEKDQTSGDNMNDVTYLAKCLFLTEHMGWRKGAKTVWRERRKGS